MAVSLFGGGCGLSFDVGSVDTGVGIDGGNADVDTPDGAAPAPRKAPQFIHGSVELQSVTTELSIGRPTGSQEGDLLLVAVHARNLKNYITPDPAVGWIVIDNMPTSTCRANGLWAYHIMGASEGNSYSFRTAEPGGPQGLAIAAYRGVDRANPINPNPKRFDVQITGSYGPISVTTELANEVVVMMVANDGSEMNEYWTPPLGMARRLDNGLLAVFDETRPSPGPLEPRMATTSSADRCGAIEMVALRPAP